MERPVKQGTFLQADSGNLFTQVKRNAKILLQNKICIEKIIAKHDEEVSKSNRKNAKTLFLKKSMNPIS